MKTTCVTIAFIFVVVCSLFGQAPAPRKLVEIKSSNPDSVVTTKIKKNKSGQITEFTQEIKDSNQRLILDEIYFNKGNRWIVTEYLDKSIVHTSRFSPEGLLQDSYYEGNAGDTPAYEVDDRYKSYMYSYYPTLKLMFKMEVRISKVKEKKGVIPSTNTWWSPWNVVEYYYPDGKPYTDWGTLKDGQGDYNILDATGKLCVPCTEQAKKLAAEAR